MYLTNINIYFDNIILQLPANVDGEVLPTNYSLFFHNL